MHAGHDTRAQVERSAIGFLVLEGDTYTLS
jgi:hypothetical protein